MKNNQEFPLIFYLMIKNQISKPILHLRNFLQFLTMVMIISSNLRKSITVTTKFFNPHRLHYQHMASITSPLKSYQDSRTPLIVTSDTFSLSNSHLINPQIANLTPIIYQEMIKNIASKSKDNIKHIMKMALTRNKSPG